MDPNAACSIIDHSKDLDSRIDAAEALYNWLRSGGFAPTHPILTDDRAALATLRGLLAEYMIANGEDHEIAAEYGAEACRDRWCDDPAPHIAHGE